MKSFVADTIVSLAMWVTALLASLPASGCATPIPEKDCERILDHYLELSAGPAPGVLTPAEFDAWLKERVGSGREGPVYRQRVRQCVRTLRTSQIECARRAKTQGDWEACVE